MRQQDDFRILAERVEDVIEAHNNNNQQLRAVANIDINNAVNQPAPEEADIRNNHLDNEAAARAAASANAHRPADETESTTRDSPAGSAAAGSSNVNNHADNELGACSSSGSTKTRSLSNIKADVGSNQTNTSVSQQDLLRLGATNSETPSTSRGISPISTEGSMSAMNHEAGDEKSRAETVATKGSAADISNSRTERNSPSDSETVLSLEVDGGDITQESHNSHIAGKTMSRV